MATFGLVILATAWGSKLGGINSFSTSLCKKLSSVVKDCSIICVCSYASEEDIADAGAYNVSLISLGHQNAKVDNSWSKEIISLIDLKAFENLWWLGHDVITGELALICRNLSFGNCVIIMHMSYEDYAYVKHNPADAVDTSNKIELQKQILRDANRTLAVGPLLYKRLVEIVGIEANPNMIVPGLSTFMEEPGKRERLSAISFGRFEASEFLTKQGLLAVASFAKAFKIGNDTFIAPLISAEIGIIGVPEDLVGDFRKIGHDHAGRVVNLKALPFIEDPVKLASFLLNSNLCLMLSWHEGFGLTAWEAISAGVPVLISQNSGVYQLLESIGGAALGCIKSVDIKGEFDGQPNKEDIETVSKKIIEIAVNIPKSISNAVSLRNLLRSKGYSWINCAESVIKFLGLPIIETPISQYEKNRNNTKIVTDGLDITYANKLLKSAENYYETGSYSQSLGALDELKKNNKIIASNYSLAMDSTLLECEVRMRLNQYPIVKGLIMKIVDKATEEQDQVRYIKAKAIENVILRDQGKYENAILVGEELVKLSSKIGNKSLIESGLRKLSRSLALGGEWKKALEAAENAAQMAKERGFEGGEATSALAIAESYRHGLDFSSAEIWYTKSRELAAAIGNTDCYLWAVLGLADSLFLLNQNPIETLKKMEAFIAKNENKYHLEKLHYELSIFATEVKYGHNNPYPTALIKSYCDLGIQWPIKYVESILIGDFSNPKKF